MCGLVKWRQRPSQARRESERATLRTEARCLDTLQQHSGAHPREELKNPAGHVISLLLKLDPASAESPTRTRIGAARGAFFLCRRRRFIWFSAKSWLALRSTRSAGNILRVRCFARQGEGFFGGGAAGRRGLRNANSKHANRNLMGSNFHDNPI